MAKRTLESVEGELAEMRAAYDGLMHEWDHLLDATLALHDAARGASGTGMLLLTYLRESVVVMKAMAEAQTSDVAKNMLRDVASRLERQREAHAKTSAALQTVLQSLEEWKAKVKA